MADWETVLRTPDLGPGRMTGVSVHGSDVVLANVGQTYYALDAHCPVDGTDLARHGTLEGDTLVCPNDHARFDVRTGAATNEEAAALRQHDVRVRGNEVSVSLREDRDRAAT